MLSSGRGRGLAASLPSQRRAGRISTRLSARGAAPAPQGTSAASACGHAAAAAAARPQQGSSWPRQGGIGSAHRSSGQGAAAATVAPAQLWAPRRRRRADSARAASSGGNGDGGGASIDDDADSGLSRLRFNKREHELPEALQGLRITEDGELLDTRTGKVVNEFGATRFDVAVRALRGELDPAPWVENTERNAEPILMSKLVTFPCDHTFTVVGKTAPGAPESRQQFVDDVVAIVSRTCQAQVPPDDVSVKERLGGKYVTVNVAVRGVRAPEIITAVYEQIALDERVRMSY